MALPSSGEISLSDVNTELGRTSTAEIAMQTAEQGDYVAINSSSTNKPDGTSPFALSEWYGYDHSASSSASNGDSFYTFGDSSTDTDRDVYEHSGGTQTSTGTPISVSMWVAPLYTNTTDINHILFEMRSSKTSTNNRIFAMYDYGLERIVVRFRGNSINAKGTHFKLSDNSTQTGISSGKWNGSNKGNINYSHHAHLVFVFDPAAGDGQDCWDMYWNGSKLTTKITNINSTIFNFNIDYISINGQTNGGGNSRYASMDDVGIYLDKKLTQSEITTLYNSGGGGSPKDLLDDNLLYYDDFERASADPASGSDYSTTWSKDTERGSITAY